MTVRLSDQAGEDLDVIARVEGTSVAETFRRAVDQYIARHEEDPHFQARLKRQMESDRAAYTRLTGKAPPD